MLGEEGRIAESRNAGEGMLLQHRIANGSLIFRSNIMDSFHGRRNLGSETGKQIQCCGG